MDENLKALIDFAIREEEEARRLYERAAGLTTDLMAQNLFRDLSAFEGEHVRTLQDLAKNHEDPSPQVVGPPIRISDYDLPGGPGHSPSLREIIAFAIRSEEKSRDLYAALATRFSNPNGVALLSKLSNDEAAHKSKLENLYQNLLS